MPYGVTRYVAVVVPRLTGTERAVFTYVGDTKEEVIEKALMARAGRNTLTVQVGVLTEQAISAAQYKLEPL